MSWTCGRCDELITEQCLSAFNRYYHFECFRCFECDQSIEGKRCVEKDGKPHCTSCIAEICASCEQQITKDGLVALDKNWHAQCFTCSKCKKKLAGRDGRARFVMHGGNPMCVKCGDKIQKEAAKMEKRAEKDRQKRERGDSSGTSKLGKLSSRLLNRGRHGAAGRCAGCKGELSRNDTMLVALNKTYHRPCFRCAKCDGLLEGNKFVAHAGKPLCRSCAVDKLAEKCEKCKQPISGTIVVALNKNWHPECLVCMHCSTPISQYDKVYRRGKSPCCPNCVEAVFSERYRPSSSRRNSQRNSGASSTVPSTDSPGAHGADEVGADVEFVPEFEHVTEDLWSLLTEDAGIDYFLKFLVSEYCVENLLFWLDVNQFRTLCQAHDIGVYSRRIVAKYLTPESELEVNVDHSIRVEIAQQLEAGPTLTMFDAALEAVMQLMSMDSFPRFLRSAECQEMRKHFR